MSDKYLAVLQVKQKPVSQTDFLIRFDKHSVVDMRGKREFNRELIMKRIRQPEKATVPKEKEPDEVQEKPLVPKKAVAKNRFTTMIAKTHTAIHAPKPTGKTVHRASSYYMNNREIFINFINN